MDELEKAASMLKEARQVCALTGAGISVESGIPDFRSPGGLWHQWNPDELTFDKFLSSRASREHYWGFSRAIWPTMAAATLRRINGSSRATSRAASITSTTTC